MTAVVQSKPSSDAHRFEESDRADSLREWACGMYALEAAAELVIRAAGGRLLRGPWVVWAAECSRWWFDAQTAAESGGYLSGGEHRLLMIAVSLVSSEHPVDLGDAVSGLDREALSLVLAAIAHAGGTHDHSRLMRLDDPADARDGEVIRFVDNDGKQPVVFRGLESLHPWPQEGS